MQSFLASFSSLFWFNVLLLYCLNSLSLLSRNPNPLLFVKKNKKNNNLPSTKVQTSKDYHQLVNKDEQQKHDSERMLMLPRVCWICKCNIMTL